MKLMRVLAGEALWPPPVWLMRQAGRYLPEYRALRERAGSFLSLCLNPALAAEVTLQPIRRYGFDAAILFSDILIPPMALGQDLRFVEGEGPQLPPLQSVDELRPDAAPAAYAPVWETVRRTRAALDPAVTLIGFCGSPFTVACYMLDGHGGPAAFPRTRALAGVEGGLLDQLVDVLVGASVVYLTGQVEAGADCVMLFDTHAGLLPAGQFHRYVTLPNQRIVTAMRALYPALRIIGFPRGAGENLGEYAQLTGVDAVGLDTLADRAAALAACPPHVALQGNLDPLVLLRGGAELAAETRAVAQAFRGRPHIFNLGHGITPDVPTSHVAAMLEILRAG